MHKANGQNDTHSQETQHDSVHRENVPFEKDLAELVTRMQDAIGANLTAAVLYGSAADHGFHEQTSDLNVLCLLGRLDGAELTKLQPVGNWWSRKGHPAPLVFTLNELLHSADIFAIELTDMKQQHRMLLGDDFLEKLDVPMDLHRLQVERELRTSVIRLRQSYLQSRGKSGEIAALMVASVSTFAALFRHSLIALGDPAPDSRGMAADQLAAKLGFDPAPFHVILDLKAGKRSASDMNHETAFAAYLNAVMQVADEMDRLLASK